MRVIARTTTAETELATALLAHPPVTKDIFSTLRTTHFMISLTKTR